ncbi:hypothetical protein J6590_012018 [Homalodisca vitripennis]|nr:hypothetical protein J6590_012018 [Homalodisca vitripennis]
MSGMILSVDRCQELLIATPSPQRLVKVKWLIIVQCYNSGLTVRRGSQVENRCGHRWRSGRKLRRQIGSHGISERTRPKLKDEVICTLENLRGHRIPLIRIQS